MGGKAIRYIAMPAPGRKQEHIARSIDYLLSADDSDDQLERLFYAFRQYEERKMNVLHTARSPATKSDEDLKYIDAIQKLITDVAMCMRSINERDILFKLALWRWSVPHLGNSLDEMKPEDALVYSAFRDLSALADETGVATPIDVKTDFLRRPE